MEQTLSLLTTLQRIKEGQVSLRVLKNGHLLARIAHVGSWDNFSGDCLSVGRVSLSLSSVNPA